MSHTSKGTRQKGRASTSRKATSLPKLSTPANQARIFSLLTDRTLSEAASMEVAQSFLTLCDSTGVSLTHPKIFPVAYLMAARGAERLPALSEIPIDDIHNYTARQEYESLQDILRRLDAGETLDAIATERRAKLYGSGERTADETPARDLVRRARAIVADSKGYDAETRRYIRNSLATSDAADLAEDVRRAEAGEECWDMADDLDGEPRPLPTLAEHIAAVLNNPDTPTLIYEALSEGCNSLFNEVTGNRRGEMLADSAAFIKLILDAAREKGGEG